MGRRSWSWEFDLVARGLEGLVLGVGPGVGLVVERGLVWGLVWAPGGWSGGLCHFGMIWILGVGQLGLVTLVTLWWLVWSDSGHSTGPRHPTPTPLRHHRNPRRRQS